ncbi:MAG: pgsA2, partial [Akkermansiaceae bacterium]|nr:pgsA2 [Akkermansiaceae bacterium]
RYGFSVAAGHPQENLRWTALIIFIVASASDGLDGWVARRFNQKSKFGAFIDPFADKVLLLTGIVFLSAFPWGEHSWRIPPWFVGLVIARDCVIIAGIVIIRKYARVVHYQPHWSGKMSTVTQMFALGWVMLKIQVLPPLYPCNVAAVFTVWSGLNYILEGMRQLQQNPQTRPATLP